MRAQRIAGWTAAIAGLLLVLGIAAASFTPGAVSGAGPGGGGPTGSCTGSGMMGTTDGHMGATGMMGSATGMMGSATGSCLGATPAGAAPIAGATEVRVRAANFAFTPTEIRLPKGEAVNLTLENPAATGVVHDFTVAALGIHIAAGAGQTTSVGLRGLAAGRYEAFCSVPGHADLGMRATVIVD